MQQPVDARDLIEGCVFAEAHFRRDTKIDVLRDLTADVFAVARQRCEHDVRVLAAKRHDIGSGKPEIRRHPHFGDRHDMRREHVIVDLTAREHLGEFVTNEFAHPQLTLRRASSGM